MRIFTAIAILILVLLPVFDAQGGAANDTLHVSGKTVVFFGPTQAEYDSLSEEEKGDMDEVLSDFYYYRQQVISFLKSNQIQEFLTASPRIQFQLSGRERRTFLRRNFNPNVGLIMADGNQEPKVFLGVATDVDLIPMFEEYFGLK
jgi:hypothetical protein